MARILLVEDDVTTLNILGTLLRTEGHEVVAAPEGQKAMEHLNSSAFDLLVTDIFMKPVNGRELLKYAHEKHPGMGVIMLTAHGSVETAIEALQLGAFDYVTKPFKVDELLITVQRALEYHRAVTENVDLRSQLESGYHLSNIVAQSSPMQQVCEMIRRVAPTDTAVLIHGESGTGKELVAKAVHEHSRRKKKRFVDVNCAALPEPLLESEMFGHVKGAFTGAASTKIGLFEAASGGTIFLDEISSMPLSIQGKILRALQEKEIRKVGSNDNVAVDVRVVAATNVDLEKAIAAGTFREDLYYRLSVIPITIPPLRDRPDDILPLISHFLRLELGPEATLPTLDSSACTMLSQYAWPGNVRELQNAVKHALAFTQGSVIAVESLPERIRKSALTRATPARHVKEEGFRGQSLKRFLRGKEEDYLRQVLAATGGDKQRAAETLRISLATLYRRLPDDDD